MTPTPVQDQGPRLFQRLREALRVRHYSGRTEQAYVGWVRRYVTFHGLRHPRELGQEEIRRFLTALAVRDRVSASTQTQALSALLFLIARWSAGIRVTCASWFAPGSQAVFPPC